MRDSNRSLLFLLGLVLGLLTGAGFFIFKMDDLLKNKNLFSSSKDTLIIQQQQIINNPDEKRSKTMIKKHIGQKDTTHQSMTSSSLPAQKYLHEISIKRVIVEADSLHHDTIPIAENQNSTENFIVRKDELLDSRNLEVVNLHQNEKENDTDSILEKVSGIKNQKNVLASFNVEFWQSPVNYKGYKMTKSVIVLFGINPDDNIKLFHLEGKIFMKHVQSYYKLYFTDDFKQFEKVSDMFIIAKLEK